MSHPERQQLRFWLRTSAASTLASCALLCAAVNALAGRPLPTLSCALVALGLGA